jgi:cytoskeletal protein RodZ
MDELIAELKSHRERTGLSLQDMFQKTRINVAFLEALEEGNFEVLPDAYVKLFLKRYAQEVKLDGDEIVKKFEKLNWKAAAAEEAIRPRRSEGLPGWAMGAAAVVLLGLVGALVAFQSESHKQSAPVTASRTQTTPEGRRPADKDSPTPTPVESDPSPRQLANAPQTVATDVDIVTTPPIDTTPASEPEPDSDLIEDAEPPPTTGDPATEVTSQTGGAPTAVVEAGSEPPAELSAETPGESEDAPTEPLNEPVVSGYSLSLRQDLTTAPGALSLTAEVLEATRITVTSDGEPVFDEQIDAGRRTGWEARDRFMIEIQNGSAVILRLLEEELPRVGNSGQKVRLFVSRSSIWVEEIEPSKLVSSTSDGP